MTRTWRQLDHAGVYKCSGFTIFMHSGLPPFSFIDFHDVLRHYKIIYRTKFPLIQMDSSPSTTGSTTYCHSRRAPSPTLPPLGAIQLPKLGRYQLAPFDGVSHRHVQSECLSSIRTLAGHEFALLVSGCVRARPRTCTAKNVNVRTRSVWRPIVSSLMSTVIPYAFGMRSSSIRGWLSGRLFGHNWSWRALGGRRISQDDLLRFRRHFARLWSRRPLSFEDHARRRSTIRSRILMRP